jgi:hypothetical protein
MELFEAIAKRVGLSEEKTNMRLPSMAKYVALRRPSYRGFAGSNPKSSSLNREFERRPDLGVMVAREIPYERVEFILFFHLDSPAVL